MRFSSKILPVVNNPRRRWLLTLSLLLVLYTGLCFGIALITIRPQHHSVTLPAKYAELPVQTVQFPSLDDVNLSGWYLRAKEKPCGVIILCHGIDGSRDMMLPQAEILHPKYDVLLFDFRARGESGGSICTLGFRETEDIIAAVRFIQSRANLSELPIGVVGNSLGASAAIRAAARCPAIRAVVAESPYARLDHAVHNHFLIWFGKLGCLIEPLTRWFGERFIGCSCKSVSPMDDIAHISPRPVLLIQDENDRYSPPSETRFLMKRALEPKELWTVPDSDHIQAIYTEPNEYKQRILLFFSLMK
jgi:pimeloyl-ACP methyl ester carboxylesterase